MVREGKQAGWLWAAQLIFHRRLAGERRLNRLGSLRGIGRSEKQKNKLVLDEVCKKMEKVIMQNLKFIS